MSVEFMITFQIKLKSVEAFVALMQQVKADLPQADGCIGVDIFRRADQSEVFTLVETWETQELHQANSQKLVDSGRWAHILGLLATEPVGAYFTRL